MQEVGAVIDTEGSVVYWHLPADRTATALGDSRTLWDVFWDNRKRIAGFAHSHPGSGVPGPSYTDVTTFAAIETALGQRLDWWITSSDHVIVLRWAGPGRYEYKIASLNDEPPWVVELRQFSEIDTREEQKP